LNVIEGLPPRYRKRAGLSPHSPYATHPDLLSATATAAREQSLLITSHVAESKPEWEMFMDRSGALFDWLRTQRRMEDCGDVTPVEHFDRQGLLNEGFLAAHANYLNDSDMDRLASRQVSVVHCPRSHNYFGHSPFAFDRLRSLSFNICLGTDSLASNENLSLFAEMRLFQKNFPQVSPEEIFRMVTVNPARALRQENALGQIQPGFVADLIAVPCSTSTDIFEQILAFDAPVSWAAVNGNV
jgi:cytosine/adenosine deaminase-related metal-dependent hydrolase